MFLVETALSALFLVTIAASTGSAAVVGMIKFSEYKDKRHGRG